MATQCQNLPILDVAFLEIFEWEASPVEGLSLQQKDKKTRKDKRKKRKLKSLKTLVTFSSKNRSQNFDFCASRAKMS